MQRMTIFQCLPSYKPIPTLKVIHAILRSGSRVLLDLEDSIQDVIQPEITGALKKQARIDLINICNALPEQLFDIRINALDTQECFYDELLLEKVKNTSSIFIPKVESAKALEAFSARHHHKYKLNIIIETVKGINNIEEILSSNVSHKIEHVFFGNYDYHLDADIYPVKEQYSNAYWDIVAPIINQVEKKQLKYGNSSYARIGDLKTLEFIVAQLNTRCKNNYAVVSLHTKQTLLFKSSGPHNSVTLNHVGENGQLLQNEFLNKKMKGRSFALTDRGNRIITPHEYLLLRARNG